MPTESTMGLKSIYYAPASSTDNTVMPTTGWKKLGDVYEKTCTFVDGDPAKKVHKSETSGKKIVQRTKGDSVLKLSIMDPDMATTAEFKGATLTGTAGARTSKESFTCNNKEYAFKVFPEAGLVLNISAAMVNAKRNT